MPPKKNRAIAFLPFSISLALGACALASAQVQLPDSIADASASITWVKKLPYYCEGPVWEPATGAVYFTQQFSNSTPDWPIWKIVPGTSDTGKIFASDHQSNGEEFDPQGRLVVCQNGRVARYKGDGTLDSVLVASSTIGQANDLSIAANGSMYFTDLRTNVFYLSPTRVLNVAATGLSQANGIEWSEAQGTVYVNETGANDVKKYTIQSPGTLSNPTVYTSLRAPDGGTVDSHGNRYVVSYSEGRVRVFNANGDSLGSIRLTLPNGTYDVIPGAQANADNCVFGGADLKTLYITGDGGLFSVPLKIPGPSKFTSPIRLALPSRIRASKPENTLDVLGRSLPPTAFDKMPRFYLR